MIRLDNVSLSFKLHYHSVGGLGAWIEILRHLASGQELHRFWALKNICFEVPARSVMGIVGPNGAGKSTLLRVIAGIYPPDQGTVYADGKVSTLLALGTGFNNSLSAVENVELAGLVYGIERSRIPSMIEEVIDFAELQQFKHVALQYYSSGMYSRLAFGIVTYMKPEILLIDEILGVGDQRFQEKASKAMRELRDRAKAQIIVSHDMWMIESQCDIAMYLDQGEVIDIGPPSKIAQRYRAM
jgi:ABC-type polysaccharide/polyol phosphate transport system ATPase subunit